MNRGRHGGTITAAALLPHAPVLVEAVGGRNPALAATRASIRTAARHLDQSRPRTLVMLDATGASRGLAVLGAPTVGGDFAALGAPGADVRWEGDVRLTRDLAAALDTEATAGEQRWRVTERLTLPGPSLAVCGTLEEGGFRCPLVVVTAVAVDLDRCLAAGKVLAAVADATALRLAVVAVGNLTGPLLAPGLDEWLRGWVESGRPEDILAVDRSWEAEPVLRPLALLAGAVAGCGVAGEVLGLEAPLGMGFATAVWRRRDGAARACH